MEKKKKKINFLKPLLIALILVFSTPIFAFAATPSEVTYDVKGATGIVPSQAIYDDFVKQYKYFYYYVANGDLIIYGGNSPLIVNNNGYGFTTNSTDTFSGLFSGGNINNYSPSEYPNVSGVSSHGEYVIVSDVPTDPVDPTDPPIQGGENNNMLESLTATSILAESTTWANNFDGLLLVVVGVGIGFACVRFVKSLFF